MNADMTKMLRQRARAAGILTFFLLAGCDGDNLFRDSFGIGPDDGRAPGVSFEAPEEGQRVAVGDSVFVQLEVSDEQGIATVELEGFAVEGSAQLGTRTEIPRFEPKTVDLEGISPIVQDTVLTRFLVATADSVQADSVYLVARVIDLSGNEATDTVRIAIGGPRSQILEPGPGAEFRPGAQVRVLLSARDTANRVQSIRLTATGELSADTLLRFDPPLSSVDTVVTLTVPTTAGVGDVELRATVRNAVNDSTVSQAIVVNVLSPSEDTNAPGVRFRASAPERGEREDSVAVTVVGVDDVRMDSVGVTLLSIHRLATGTDTLSRVSVSVPSDSATFRFSLAELGLPVPSDTSTLRIETTAYAIDSSGNCSTATQPTPTGTAGYADPCSSRNPVLGARSGARFEILVVPGRTLRVGSPGDTIIDMVANSTHLYLSNYSRNRLEVLPVGTSTFLSPVSVGSKPWGLAFNENDSRLYVANSGGTNLSVVSPTTREEVERIQTPNVKLYDVPFTAELVEDPASPGDSISALFPESVTRHDYSDRPQFIGVTANENVIFSTVPTSAALEGTVRVYHQSQDRLEIVTDYAEERIGSVLVIANADSVFLVAAQPNNLIQVCPRNRSIDPALDRTLPKSCFTGSINEVQNTIESAGYDTQFLYSLSIDEIGLSDTTFVAVSGDHSTVAFGEGARDNGRVVSLVDPAGQTSGPLVKFGEIRDLVGNAAERIIGLALNSDGSLGLARGSEAFFFSRDLRLQGFVNTEAGFGGVDMHPENPTIRRAFVPGVQPDGLAFIDVMDTFHFRRVSRIFLRDPVVGPIRAVPSAGGVLRIYAITASGLLTIDVDPSDL